jgi:hypothetical protein
VHITALSALMVLLRQPAGAGDSNSTTLSNAPTCGVRKVSYDQNRADSIPISSRSSPGRSKHHKTIRFLRSGRTGTAAVADAARRGAPGASFTASITTSAGLRSSWGTRSFDASQRSRSFGCRYLALAPKASKSTADVVDAFLDQPVVEIEKAALRPLAAM